MSPGSARATPKERRRRRPGTRRATGPGRGPGRLGWPIAAAFVYGIGCAAVWVYGRTLLEEPGGMPVALSAGAWIALGVGGAAAVLTAPWLARHSIRLTWPVTVLATGAATCAMAFAPGSIVISFTTAALFGLSYTAATSVLIIWAGQAAASSAAGTSVLFISHILWQAAGAAHRDHLPTVRSPLRSVTSRTQRVREWRLVN